MRIVFCSLCFLIANICGCSQHQTAAPSGPDSREGHVTWPKDWSAHLGQTVTLEGRAVDAKLGALLQGEEASIWLDGLDSWPEGFFSGGDQGKRIRVTGTVIKKDDVPVFVQRPGEPPRAGIPVTSEEEQEKGKWRYLLKDTKWTVLE